jgi:TetR/AcrR family transcriptional regulator, cholesterol catabolism regulator
LVAIEEIGVGKSTSAAEEAVGTGSRLLAEGAALFRERGFYATTTREISARLGINKASLYYHVTSKEALLHDICIESLRRTKLALADALAAQEDQSQWIPTLIHAHVRSMLTDLEMHATMLFEMRCLTGDYYADVKASRDEYEAMVLKTVTGAQEVGALRTDLTAKQLAMGVLNLMNWTLSWWSPEGGLTPDQLADLLADMYLNGALPSVLN